jgi:hypothetical protein
MSDTNEPRHKQSKKGSTPPQLGSFVRKHQQLLTFAGALIVFLTFVLKEGFRDGLRDLIDSIESAESVFMIRSDGGDTYFMLGQLQSKIDLIQEEMMPAASLKNRYFIEAALQNIALAENLIHTSTLSLDNDSRLLERLPHHSRVVEEFHGLFQDLNNLQKLDTETAEKVQSEQSEMIVHGESQRLLKEAANVSGRMLTFGHQVLNDARALRGQRERSYVYVTWASYGLYIIGWGLGLISKLYGVGYPSSH